MTNSSFSNVRLPVLWLMLALMVVMPVRGLLAMEGADCGHDESMQGMMDQHTGMSHHFADTMQTTAAQSMDCCDTQCDCNNCVAVSIPFMSLLALPLSASLVSGDFVVMDTTQFASLETRPLLQPPAVQS